MSSNPVAAKEIIYWQWQFNWLGHWLWHSFDESPQKRDCMPENGTISAISNSNRNMLDFAVFTK